VQEKNSEIIVKRGGAPAGDHRTRKHYDTLIAESFRQARRVVAEDGLVTIVFGHGDYEVWHRLLTAISNADLVMTGSWPAKTEAGGAAAGAANIVTTLTMSCRPAAKKRATGRSAAVEVRVRDEISKRVADWEQAGLAPADMLMASAGPAMEVVGEYARILDSRAEAITDLGRYLLVARRAVQEALAVEIDHHPLEAFDPRTRFALWWVNIHGRELTAKSDLRWEALAADMPVDDVKDLVPAGKNGCRFVESSRFKKSINADSAVIEVALALARALADGLAAVADLLVASGRSAEDEYLWAAMRFLADRLPASDADVAAWTRILRNRSAVGSAAKSAADAKSSAAQALASEKAQLRLL
jgi:putative DNA methylase